MAVQTRTSYSVEEYLELEQASEFRNEYIDGYIIPMSGGSANHNRICTNLLSALLVFFDDKAFDVFMSDMRLWVPSYKRFTYPDVMVIESDLQFLEGRKDTLTNASIVAEVLSGSTEAYDRGEKFKMYRAVPSLKEYILMSQNAMRVDHFVKNDEGQWLLSDYEDADATLKLQSIPFEIRLKDLYKRVTFDDSSNP